MSYYKTIEGVAYDRALLDLAEHLIQGKGDGRISQSDAQELLANAGDGGRITPVELRTLSYIGHQFTWTDAAKTWFEEQLYQAKPYDIQAEIEKIIRTDYQIEGLQAQLDTAAVEAQMKLPGSVPFNLSLLEALDAIFTYDQHSDAPVYLIRQIHGIEADENFAWREKTTQLLRQYLSKGQLFLYTESSEDAPPEGEKLSNFWIYYLYLPSLSDHQFWILVDRTGETDSYLYGIN